MPAPTDVSRRLLARLHRDLAELLEQPYPGVAVFTDDADIRKFCLVLTPPAGPWTGLNLHFDVVLPEDWPSQPPQVSTSVNGIDHPNLFGNGYICCDLLKLPHYLERGYTGGYTPALTLRGLFLQFLTFFSSTSIEQDYGGSVWIGDRIVTNYVEDRYMSTANPWEPCCWVAMDLGCGCRPSHGTQAELKARYEANPREEIVLETIQTAKWETVIHMAKKNTPRFEQIHKFEMTNPRYTSTLKHISKWTCSKCPYGSSALPHLQSQQPRVTQPQVASLLTTPPSRSILDEINDDVLLELSNHLTSESVIALGQAYPRFYSLATMYRILLQREVRCFFLKTQLHDGILGIGIAFNPGPRTLSSDFDWLSMEAFDVHKVRKSIEKRDFGFFLPLAFSPSHFERARVEIWKRLGQIDGAIRETESNLAKREDQASARGRGYGRGRGRGRGRGGGGRVTATRPAIDVPEPKNPQDVVRVIYKMMNNIVTALMKSCDDAIITLSRHRFDSRGLLMASEKAIISYCHLMHLLICLARSSPVILRDAVSRLQRFLASRDNRTKTSEPDMGELIVVMTFVLIMSPPNDPNIPNWSMLNGSFLEEAIIRNVRWVLRDSPELEVLEPFGASTYRLETTFIRSKTSLRLLMFQVTFLDLFLQAYRTVGVQALDENYGFSVKELPELMVIEIKDIYTVGSWLHFFGKVQYARAQAADFTKERFTGMLRDAVRSSERRGYHTATRDASRRAELVDIRRRLDRDFN